MLDRRIVISIEAEGSHDDLGEFVAGPVTSYPVWAERSSAGAVDVEVESGERVVLARNYTVRWFQELQDEVDAPDRVSIIDDHNIVWNVESIA